METVQAVPLPIISTISRWVNAGFLGPRAGMLPAARIIQSLHQLRVQVASAVGAKGRPRPPRTDQAFPEWDEI